MSWKILPTRISSVLIGSLFAFSVNAVPLSITNVIIDAESIQFSPGVVVDDAFLETYVEVSSSSGAAVSSDVGDAFTHSSVSTGNSEALAGFAGDGIFEANTISESNSLFNPQSSAISELSLFLPFSQTEEGGFSVTADYGVLSIADTENSGEYAASSYFIGLEVLDSVFSSTGLFTQADNFLEEFDGSSSEFDFFGQLGLATDSLSTGDYYLAFDLGAASFTEAIANVNRVPEPSVLVLFALGMLIFYYINIASRKQKFTYELN